MNIQEMEKCLIMLQNSRAMLDILISHRETEMHGIDDWNKALSGICDYLELGIEKLEILFNDFEKRKLEGEYYEQ